MTRDPESPRPRQQRLASHSGRAAAALLRDAGGELTLYPGHCWSPGGGDRGLALEAFVSRGACHSAHASLVKVLQRAQPVIGRRRMKAPRGLWGQQLGAPRGHPLGKLGCEGSRESGQDPKGCRVQGGCLFSKMEEKTLDTRVCLHVPGGDPGGIRRERETDALGVRGPKRPRSRGPKEHLPRSCSS